METTRRPHRTKKQIALLDGRRALAAGLAAEQLRQHVDVRSLDERNAAILHAARAVVRATASAERHHLGHALAQLVEAVRGVDGSAAGRTQPGTLPAADLRLEPPDL